MITYDDVVKFYKDKENVVDYDPQDDKCQKLAETFFYGSGTPDDCIYSLELKKRMIDGTLTQLATFQYFEEQEAYKLVLSGFTPKKQKNENKMIINPSQKWHLYVSYIAYQEIKAKLNFSSEVTAVPGNIFNEKQFCFGKQVKQKEYVKWMKSALGLDEKASWKEVEKTIEDLKKNNI